MTNYPYKYKLTLNFAFPNTEAPLNLESEEVEKQIYESQILFNSRFEDRKEINIYKIKGQTLYIELLISFIPSNVTREISVFSQILVKNYHFDQYSAKPNRLFRSVIISRPKGIESAREKLEVVKEDVAHYTKVLEPTIRMAHKTYIQPKVSVFVSMTNEILGTNDIDKLESYLKQLHSLITMVEVKRKIIIESEIGKSK